MDKLAIGLEIIKKLNAHSYQAYIVGGAVRDYIRGETITDVDITTNALPEEIAEVFQEVSLEGKDYLSCRIHYKDVIFEVTTFRRDMEYLDHRHPVIVQADSLEEDLVRRDFTMNALVMNQEKKIIDLFEGIKAIEEKVIYTIGNPKKRFNEDGLRVLRALDFASRFSFRLDQTILDSFEEDYLKPLKEEYIITMLQKISQNLSPIGLEYIAKYNLLRSFPFYQVACEEAVQYKYYNLLALFYTLHNFLPRNLKISKKDYEAARDIAFLVRNSFDSISLYYGNTLCIEEAIRLYNCFNGDKLSIEEVMERWNNLPIHSAKDIQMDWTNIPSEKRSCITKKIELAILQQHILNRENQITKYLEIEE